MKNCQSRCRIAQDIPIVAVKNLNVPNNFSGSQYEQLDPNGPIKCVVQPKPRMNKCCLCRTTI